MVLSKKLFTALALLINPLREGVIEDVDINGVEVEL